MSKSAPLVSIVVITYNSSKYILDILESAGNQTYKNIELIISDDGSTDETITICRNWLSKNQGRFVNSELVLAEENSGIPANCNRGMRASRGEWVKLIAGDDILLPNCIGDSLEFAEENGFQQIVSELQGLQDGVISDFTANKKVRTRFFDLDVEQKYQYYLVNPFFLNVPSLFFHKATIESVDPYDENIRLLEDQPYLLKTLKAGVDIGLNPEQTVIYRMHSESIVGRKVNIGLQKALYECFLKYRKPFINNTVSGTLLKWLLEKNYRKLIAEGGNPLCKRLWLHVYGRFIQITSRVYLSGILK